jgi:UDP-N-acetylglucosamine acyltransferase
LAIHPTAIIDSRAIVHPETEIGPYVVIEGPVSIGRGTRVMAHAFLSGWTEIGEDNEIHPGAVVGHAPQDLAYQGEKSYLKVGNRNVIREHVQIHRATGAGLSTVIGNQNFLMANSHVGHNCRLSDGVTLANGALLGGHVEVGSGAFVSGNCVVHQFVRIGRLALMRGLSGASRDVPPFSIVDWQHTVRAVNVVGLKRAGFSESTIRRIKESFSVLFRTGRNLSLALQEIEKREEWSAEVAELIDFIRASKRGVSVGGLALGT